MIDRGSKGRCEHCHPGPGVMSFFSSMLFEVLFRLVGFDEVYRLRLKSGARFAVTSPSNANKELRVEFVESYSGHWLVSFNMAVHILQQAVKAQACRSALISGFMR